MGELISSVITLLCFVVAPSLLLGHQYNFAVGFAYFCAMSGLISLHFTAGDIKSELALIKARFGSIPKGATPHPE